MSFWSQYWHVVLFYIGIIALIYFNRSKFEFQGKIIALLRGNWGLKWMNKYGEKHAKGLQLLGYIGVGVGYLGMVIILGFLAQGMFNIFFRPEAPPVLSPVLPGVKIPGSPVALPLLEGLLALFIVVVVHEAAHGLVAAAHKIKVKGSGLVLFGPLPGAFVEPDEKKLKKQKDKVQLSVFAAGPFSNVLLAILFLGLTIGFASFVSPLLEPNGMMFEQVVPGSPADQENMDPSVKYIWVESEELNSVQDLTEALADKKPGDQFMIGSEKQDYYLTLAAHPEDPELPRIGIEGISQKFQIEEDHPWVFSSFVFIQSLLFWVFVLSLGLGLANLLPIGPVDGGRMFQLAMFKFFGKEKGNVIWAKTASVLLVVIVILIFVPIVSSFF